MGDFAKHRLEAVELKVEFAAALNTGDTVAAISGVLVTRGGGSVWTDVSAEFGNPTGDLAGSTVTVMLGAAATATDQERGPYTLLVTVTTTGGETLVATPSLEVTALGDPDQP